MQGMEATWPWMALWNAMRLLWTITDAVELSVLLLVGVCHATTHAALTNFRDQKPHLIGPPGA